MTQSPANADSQSAREKIVRAASRAIFAERFVPYAASASAPLAVVAMLGLFNAHRLVPIWTHWLLLIGAAALSGFIAWRIRPPAFWPARAEALRRVEADGGVRHEAAQAMEDAPFAGDPALFEAHRRAMAQEAGKARLAGLRALFEDADPNGARFAALAIFAVGLVAAGADAPARLGAVFWPRPPVEAAAADLWIEPPAYAGKAPIFLMRAGVRAADVEGPISAPEGARIIAQLRGKGRLSMTLVGGGEKWQAELSADGRKAELVATQSGTLRLKAGGRMRRFALAIAPDGAPTILFLETPAATADGKLLVRMRIDDDFGAARIALRMRLDPDQDRPLDAPAIEEKTLAETRIVDIPAARNGDHEATLALDAHPWAGKAVIATLVATDDAAQEGASAEERFALPARAFFNPLARAVVEQRETLALAPGSWRRAEWAFNGLTLAPEYFFEKPTDYLLLRTAMWRVGRRQGEKTDATVEELWPLALQFENETLELARQRLEAARDALADALASGADDETVERLTEAMRNALNAYVAALAQSGASSPDDAQPADQEMAAAELDDMLNDVRDLAKKGARSAAQQALDDLKSVLDNLRFSKSGGGSGEEAGAGGASGEAGDLIVRQRDIANEAFAEGETRAPDGGALSEAEGGLAGDLADLIGRLDGAAKGAAGKPAPKALSQALADMRRAERALAEQEFNSASAAMERAIGRLREAAGELADREQQQAQGGAPGARDPLGRPIGDSRGDGVDLPEIPDQQRARELLIELRRRLANGERTEDEIDYLERLLERF
jgi:uncharacterized protein (TIGR02302 family)